ncbi:hypothetical protein EUGRSUZ_B03622 [Eucalyptus grandis]|uniref:Uncharacterized protein n=2 Tax=Eucalyptus grandis TaxID=71139 RepID=A0ACC3LYC1_EUCGR|nr:hypothetical protein EUGRSUZ_B03622 [Eucalyptus grandis]
MEQKHQEVPASSARVNRRASEKGRENDETRVTRKRLDMDANADINELADAFIRNFRNQLRIQREESLKRFQEMISRGV